MELVSVIVPVYKVEDVLRRCIDSVLAQSYGRFELILVDDGSPDRCGEICDAYAAADERVTCLHQANRGVSAARNAGIDAAGGAYIAFVDGDDWISRDFLDRLISLAGERSCDIAVGAFVRTASEDGGRMPSEDAELSVLTTPQALSALAEGPLTIPLTVPWGKVYRRHLFDGCRFPVGRVHEDIFVAHRLLHRARGVATTSQVLYYYWQRPDSMMGSGPSEKSVRDAVDGLLEQARFMQDEGFDRESVLVVKQAVLKFSKFTFRHAGPRSYLPGPWNSPFQREVRKVLLQCRPFRGSAGLGSNVYLAAHLFFPVEANRLTKVLRKYHQPS